MENVDIPHRQNHHRLLQTYRPGVSAVKGLITHMASELLRQYTENFNEINGRRLFKFVYADIKKAEKIRPEILIL